MFKKLIIASVIATAFSTSMLAHAGSDLTINNNTACPSTTITNHSACSTILGTEIGVSPPHQTHTVSAYWVGVACIMNKHNCSADLYMTDNCKGAKVATITFDVDTGIKTITNLDNPYKMTASVNAPFEATIAGGSDNAADCPSNK